MTNYTLYPHQTDGVNEISALYAQGVSRILYQLATGGGKTVTFAGMTHRYLQSFNKKVVIMVHRDELLKQTRKTLYNGFGIYSEPVTRKTKNLPDAQVYVCMVETAHNRLKKNPKYFGDTGMLIVDECHRGEFNKCYPYFESELRVGFSATPIASSKKTPLKNYYDKIVIGPAISQLIEMKKLSQNETYSIKGINRKDFKKVGNDFNNGHMGQVYSNNRNVANTLDAYVRLCENKKTLIFNCNVEHSKMVNQCFLDAGLDSKHLDGKSKDRKQILEWFRDTPNAILNGVDVLTTGFDEPSLINVIINRSTMSLPLWLQMTGRGARIFPNKDYFRIIDMGGNALTHGDWRTDIDWASWFYNPENPSDGSGVAPIKSCEGCEAIIPAQAIECKLCGHIHERRVEYDAIAPEFELLVGRIDVQQIMEKNKDSKEWRSFFIILDTTITMLKYRIGQIPLTPEVEQQAFERFEIKVKEWRRKTGKSYSRYTKEFVRTKFAERIEELRVKQVSYV